MEKVDEGKAGGDKRVKETLFAKERRKKILEGRKSGERKLVLIEPKSPGVHIYSKMKLPRLGAVLLATIMKNKGWKASVFVEEIMPVDYKEALDADLVGISTITSTATRAYAIADALREFSVPVVMGGPHTTFLPDEALEHCDYVIRGEGEEALPMLAEAIAVGGELSEIPNLSYRDKEGRIRHNERRSTITDLDALPFPDYNLISGWGKIKSFGNLSLIPLQASRGCPFSCNFCSVIGMFGRKMRLRSPENVLDEISRYAGDRTHIFFYDDNFAANVKWTKELLRKADERGMNFRWSAQVRTDVARDEELLALMKKRCSNLYIGFESVNPMSLKEMKKSQDPAQMALAAKTLKRYDIDVHGMFVFGFDNDTEESIKETIKFARNCGIASVQFLILAPLPGTPLFEQLKAEKRITVTDWALYDTHHVVFKPKNISPFALQRLQLKGHDAFYSLSRMLRNLATARFSVGAVCLYARNLNSNWKRSNNIYLKALELMQKAKEITPVFDFKAEFEDIKANIRLAAQQLAFLPT